MRIYSENISIEFGIESGKRNMTEGIERLIQEKIRMLGVKETYKYLGILEADAIKHVEIKKKLKKNTSGERENFWKPNSITGISLRV